MLAAKRVTLVFCGFTEDSPIGKALRSVEVLGVGRVELFGTFKDATECEFLLRLAIGKMTNIFWLCWGRKTHISVFGSIRRT